MPVARIGRGLLDRVTALETDFASGFVNTPVTGSSTGYGGINPPVYVSTAFLVKAAVANLATEYETSDAQKIKVIGDATLAGQMRVTIPGTGVGFYVEYYQQDQNIGWTLSFNWYARG